MMVHSKTTTVKVRKREERTAKGEVRECEKDYTEARYSLIVANDRNEHFIPLSWLTYLSTSTLVGEDRVFEIICYI